MRFSLFGRKNAPEQEEQPSASDADRRHAAFLAELREREKSEPRIRARIAGGFLYSHVSRGPRTPDLLAMLAYNGGFACIVSALQTLAEGAQPPPAGALVEIGCANGLRFYFGDLPNRLLWESDHSLLRLMLEAAEICGGSVSPAMVVEVMRRTAETVGGPGFATVNVPEEHKPVSPPQDHIHHLWPIFRAGLDLYEVPHDQRPMAFGYALQQALGESRDKFDPTTAATICTECAVPGAKFDPALFP